MKIMLPPSLLKPFLKSHRDTSTNKHHSLQLGMAATEYILGLVLVAVAAITTFTVFGAQIKTKIAQVTAAIGGNHDKYEEAQNAGNKNGESALTNATKEVDMKGQAKDDFTFQSGGGN